MKLAATFAIANLVHTPFLRRSHSNPDLLSCGEVGIKSRFPFLILAQKQNPLVGIDVFYRHLVAIDSIANLILWPISFSGHSSVGFCFIKQGQVELPTFGRDYIIPKPFDERLLVEVPTAVVQAAIDTGVARLTDMDVHAYHAQMDDLASGMQRSNL